jgi:hypothetical protein
LIDEISPCGRNDPALVGKIVVKRRRGGEAAPPPLPPYKILKTSVISTVGRNLNT